MSEETRQAKELVNQACILLYRALNILDPPKERIEVPQPTVHNPGDE